MQSRAENDRQNEVDARKGKSLIHGEKITPKMAEKAAKQDARSEAIAKLREWLSPGDTVYTILRHVSRSGMQREISVVVNRNGEHLHPDYSVAKTLGMRQGKRDGVIVGGCGMDMGFHLVYNLGATLWPDGFGEKCLTDGCEFRPKTKHEAEHCNDGLAAGVTPHRFRGRNGDTSGWDDDGGYALKHRWL